MRGALAFALAVAAALAAVAGPAPARQAAVAPAEALRVQVLRSFPHDRQAFTQGLELDRGRLFESTGLYGRSSVREVEQATGRVLRLRSLAPALFGEGLTVVGRRIVQLTWREQVAPVWKAETFERARTFRYDGEGWGICFDGRRLVTSDGTSTLTFRDPASFRILGRRRVTVRGTKETLAGLPPGPVYRLNELECVGRRVYANVWMTNRIVRIDARTGRVDAVIDASGLLTADEAAGADVLNGIAYDATRKTFLVTGKLWPKLFEVRFVAR